MHKDTSSDKCLSIFTTVIYTVFTFHDSLILTDHYNNHHSWIKMIFSTLSNFDPGPLAHTIFLYAKALFCQYPKALLCDWPLKVISHLQCAKLRKVETRKLNFIPFLLGWIYSPSDILQTLRHSIFLIAKILVASLLSLVMVCSPVLAVKIDTFRYLCLFSNV